MTDDLAAWLRDRLDEDERIARAASGGTVVGEPGNWQPSPTGDEWEAHRSDDGDEELLVALRPGLPRPPDAMSGMWGAAVSDTPDPADRDAWSAMPRLEHAARHDPARVLAEVAAKRRTVASYESAAIAHGVAARGTEVHDLMTGSVNSLRYVLRMLAVPYAQHPDFREEWKP